MTEEAKKEMQEFAARSGKQILQAVLVTLLVEIGKVTAAAITKIQD